jgi:hypothetical protein
MGLGQTLLTIMSLMLMGRLILSTNTGTLNAGYTKDLAEYRITATSLGTSMLEYANALAFDKATADTFVTASRINELTASNSLGPETGEVDPSTFNDIDDYNNFYKIDTVANSAIFRTDVSVEFVNVTSGSISATSSKTFNKQITVKVTSNYLVDYSTDPPKRDTLKFRSIYSYWYFR